MSKIQWEYDLVERSFCEQLRAMGWQWIEGDTDVPEFTERTSFSEVLLKGRLAAALRKLNLRDGAPWLDEDRTRRIITKLEKPDGHRLMEINESTTRLLLKGTEIDGLPDWNFGRNQPIRFIDFEIPGNNDFLVINQLKVDLTSGRGHVIPDAVLFVNGIPLVVAEFKSPGIQSPLRQALHQLLRYSIQRREIWPALYPDNEGVVTDRTDLQAQLGQIVEKEVTFSETIRFEEFPRLNDSEKILVLVDEAHRSHTRTLHRNLRKALPNAAIIGFTGTPILSREKKETREIFGDLIDKYILQDAELDGATVPILYEGRTADAIVKDAPSLDAVFEDLFREFAPDELAVIKAKYATESDVMEAPLLIERKARDIIRHYARQPRARPRTASWEQPEPGCSS
jgi:type I site-specific restriction-modification system R (restriction) subunit